MNYSRSNAKAYARQNMKGIWAAALMPFTEDLQIDEEGFRQNVRHWTEDLGIEGLFIAGKQGEFFSMTVDERKRSFELAVEATRGRGQTIMSCSDQNMDVVMELAHHAEDVGADYIVVHAPALHFTTAQDETLMSYYRSISDNVDIGIALWSHPDSGYLMSPELCNRLADLENVVAIKYSVPRPMYSELSALASDRIHVSTASEDEWLDNIIELDWKLYLCSSPPFLLQTTNDRRMHEYTQAAFEGRVDDARRISASLDPVRAALKGTRPPEKPHAHQKYWQELLGQVGGRVRVPLLELTEDEKRITREAFEQCGLGV
ncbi:MAG: dihydrodipicolinate synthase family protein [Acidimicrobiales bacterium]|jgi:4-hydroxy-tetrahydrodipicolinate synthase|nr:dihydrodipicolinate synthase family protein [Acidimicrobiales bacterium]|tara:strand:+ start:998 stop:1951 length:954 start_codon:yes stop_codon:yes gene_type:complete